MKELGVMLQGLDLCQISAGSLFHLLASRERSLALVCPPYGEPAGKWKYQQSEGSEDFGLFIPDKAKKYGIATVLPEPVDLTKGPVVLQYDVRLQKGYDCGAPTSSSSCPRCGASLCAKKPVDLGRKP